MSSLRPHGTTNGDELLRPHRYLQRAQTNGDGTKNLSLIACLLMCSCAAKHSAKVIIPANCIHVTITDFTKPCFTRPDGTLRCDGVVIRPTCSQVAK